MSGYASATGLLDARIRPVYRPKPKHVELTGSTKPAPFILRPFSGLFNPYPYGCSVLCNHPADCEAKEVLKRAKDSWASEGKALLLPEEMDMIRKSLAAAGGPPNTNVAGNTETEVINDAATVPEELFRRYTETDSRPVTPAPTLASGPASTNRLVQEQFPITCNPQERTTLVLDLRAKTRKQLENETFSWHALTLEPPPSHRKAKVSVSKPVPRHRSAHQACSPDPPLKQVPNMFPSSEEINDDSNSSSGIAEEQHKEVTVVRRRGRRLRRGKRRRGSAYGQQTEVCDLFDTTETQIARIGDSSGRTSVHTTKEDAESPAISPRKTAAPNNTPPRIFSSFIDPEILKHLGRELDSDKVEAEFSIRRKIAFEEALRAKGESYSRSRRSQVFSNPVLINTPRVFSRQAARFEILGSESLHDTTVTEYLGKHVFVSSGRKLIFAKTFNKFQGDAAIGDIRYVSPNDIREALADVMGRPIPAEQEEYFMSMIGGKIKEPVNFRTWCGLCAAAERLICPLPPKETDPPTWLERVDFETLERRLKSTDVDATLARFLREIRDK